MNGENTVKDLLPHRFPFLLVDRVIEVDPGRRAVAVKRITGDGYYNGIRGISGDMLIIEAMAQVGALAASKPAGEASGSNGTAFGFLAALGGVRFLKRPAPGDEVVMTLEFQACFGELVRFKGVAEIDGEPAAEATLTFSVPAVENER